MRHCRVVAFVALMRRLDAGAERREAERAFDLDRRGPGAVALAEGDFVERRAAQAAAGHEERNGFEEVGLAGAVRPDQHHHVARDLDLRRAIAAEIGELQAVQAGGGHGKRI